jgi:hypothetical protein
MPEARRLLRRRDGLAAALEFMVRYSPFWSDLWMEAADSRNPAAETTRRGIPTGKTIASD